MTKAAFARTDRVLVVAATTLLACATTGCGAPGAPGATGTPGASPADRASSTARWQEGDTVFRVAGDRDLLRASDGTPNTLAQEIKFQLLASLETFATPFGERARGEGGVEWTELSVVELENVRQRYFVTFDGKLIVAGGEADFEVETEEAVYGVTMAFVDRSTGAVSRYRMSKPFRVAESLRVKGKGSLALKTLDALPEWLGDLLSEAVPDINVSLRAGGEYTARKRLPTYLSWYDAREGTTAFMVDASREILQPLCGVALKADAAGRCAWALPVVGGPRGPGRDVPDVPVPGTPVEDPFFIDVRACAITDRTQLANRTFVLYGATPRANGRPAAGAPLLAFERQDGGWKHVDKWNKGRYLGEVDASDAWRCGELPADEACVKLEWNKVFWESACRGMASARRDTGLGFALRESDVVR